MNPLLLGGLAIGAGLWWWKNRQTVKTNAQASIPPIPPLGLTFDPGMTQATQDTVSQELLIDNDPVNLRSLAAILRSKGYNNAAAALETKAAACQATGGIIVPPPLPPTVLVQQPQQPIPQDLVNQAAQAIAQVQSGIVPTASGNVPASQLIDPSTPMTYQDVQHALNLLGILGQDNNPLVEDGLPGPNSSFAISTFEGQHNLPQDGVPGPMVYASLRGALLAHNIGL